MLPIVVHGDAAIAGQGLPYEIVQMARLKGYGTGGTVHIVVNNQMDLLPTILMHAHRPIARCSQSNAISVSV